MQTYLQAKRILEDSFTPYRCQCTLEADGSMTVQLLAPNSCDVELTIPQIPRHDWDSLRAVAKLALELRQALDMALSEQQRPAKPLSLAPG
ncbi:Protein of unknown function [Pseudomonas citronellolis]|jgi:hypothetical protein|uniref:Uncharacterized protein n=1 Tax=Pseudomonas citronellolis TaxID=53408 RepID=A0A127MTN1_9PSED|nr:MULTISPECIES: DUF1652 domain-containing protein [Pseudomonas]KSW22011.1 hypothetical protein AOX63_00800 [Pseudomonas sp. ADP]AMO76626.1 hypothetical protein PcP3B5_32070 [Pseudomonas citronellolis]ANI15286.1 hypothetical protein A9C11_15415 [Pseudomonas citronellolis]KES21140.1 hypothetical protein FG99_27245 [Pseudomonas sp. AAC]KRV64036.1 hypothetical protein AO742_08240 [Pseudomonas citronellolis]